MCDLPAGSLVVKRTFLEFVTPPLAQAGRGRRFTDTQLLESAVCVREEVESVSLAQPAVPEASPALEPAWPMTPVLDALYEPVCSPASLEATVGGEVLSDMGTWLGSPHDAAGSEQWLLPAAAWTGGTEDEQLVYQQPWVWMPVVGLEETCATQGTCWADLSMWPLSPAPSAGSTEVGSEVASTSEASDSEEPAGEACTTLMLRNLPTSLTRNGLLLALEKIGFAGSFDMLYVPVDFSTGAGLGYAFVNAVSPGDVASLWKALDGLSTWGDLGSDKACEVNWSEPNQGLAAHIERYRNSPVMHPATPDEWKPAVFAQGVRVEFPAPTKKIKAPKVRGKKAEAA